MFNKKFPLYSHINRNVVHPSISLDPVECRQNTAVEIVELNNSSDDCGDNTDNSFNYEPEIHPWSFISQDLYSDEDSYRINKTARERRRFKESTDGLANTTSNQERGPEQTYPSFYCFERDNSKYHDYKSYANRQVNCFTIPNNLGTSSTSSDDQNVDIDRIQCGDTNPNRNFDKNTEYDEVYFSQDADTDKRTIWIYSFKNRRTLSENDYILTNMPSKDSSSCTSSTDDLELEPTKESQSTRLATPIPFIPRLNLNLTSTLPTLTEVIEPTKHSSCATDINPAQAFQTTPPLVTNVTNNNLKTNFNENSFSPRIQKLSNADHIAEKVYCEPTVIISSRSDQIANEQSNRRDVQDNDTLLLEKPHIKICLKPLSKDCEISDPIEKLEGNWIGENITAHSDPPIVYQLDLPPRKSPPPTPKKEIENTFFINNLPLLKPAEWNEYMPITDSMPSIELSIISNVDTKKSWFMKLFKCVRCLKD
ncbi:unnamed protein product [Pieris macdunnoughi]|uniref:Uncharacterized protein n=1 Tax=Pieris macdunnoughi TaxID=345717 RepID=A0A821QH47_9NEOP|nr:unnamed protein product [Pieris macdunnoughi]